MVCVWCEAVERLVHAGEAGMSGRDAVEGQPCERCGRVIEAANLSMVSAKVRQLAQFGLAGAPPLLARRPR